MSEIVQSRRFCGVLCISPSTCTYTYTATAEKQRVSCACMRSWRAASAAHVCAADALFLCGSWASCFTAPCTLVQSAVLRSYIVRLSVCLSVTFRYRDQIFWNSSRIISLPNSLRPLLWLIPTWAIWCNGNTSKIGVEHWWGHSGAQKPAISPKRCKIGPRSLLRTNGKSYTRFWLSPKSVTLNNLERRIQGLHKVFKYAVLSQDG